MKTLIAIPCYRCANQVGRVLKGLTEASVSKRYDKILVIDNCSPDETFERARAAVKTLGLEHRATVIRNPRNVGLGGSHKVAFRWAGSEGFDRLAIIHGDSQASAADLPDLLDEADRHPELAAVLGARFMPGSRLDGYSKLRTLGNRGLNLVYSAVSLRKTYDLGSGLNVFVLRDLSPGVVEQFSDGFTFNIDLLLYLYASRSPIQFVPITWSEFDQVSNAGNVRVGLGALKALLKWAISGRGRELARTPGP